jgi:hypothetical protein
MLEALAVLLYDKYPFDESFQEKYHNLMSRILCERCHKLNDNFEWTNENKQKLLNVNDKITQVFEAAYNEALSVAHELEARIENNDAFIKDYEIEIKITTYINEKDSDGYTIGDVIGNPVSGYYPINDSISHSSYERGPREKPLYLDKKLNWNHEYFWGEFDDYYIGYGIHALLDTSEWSFQDIVNIGKIWADVQVWHQHYVDLP